MADGAVGTTFKVCRMLQAACMIAVIGMTSNFVSQIVAVNVTPPPVVIGTLSVVCIAVLYCIITFILYLDNLLPYFVATVVDCLFLIALIVVSVVVGKPLSYLNCNIVGRRALLSSGGPSFASAFSNSLADGRINYGGWVGTSKATCLEMKSIWGLSIALCILFTLSATTTVCLWKRAKQNGVPVKGEA